LSWQTIQPYTASFCQPRPQRKQLTLLHPCTPQEKMDGVKQVVQEKVEGIAATVSSTAETVSSLLSTSCLRLRRRRRTEQQQQQQQPCLLLHDSACLA
jgi:hypothetical protein